MRISALESTQLFGGTAERPRQIVRLSVDDYSPGAELSVRGTSDPGVSGGGPASSAVVEIALDGLDRYPVGAVVDLTVNDSFAAQVTVADAGWTVWMIPHFHYDPVWWNTQAAYTATWDSAGEDAQRTRIEFQQAGFDLVRLHLETARRDNDYKFVLAEVDYLKPYWDAHPEDRAYLRLLLAQDRLEIMGGTYNEPNTNLTTSETTIRNFVYGMGFQRDILGADPRTAWQLDAFGHDPQFPGLAADAGLTSSSWARGPFHQWGPMLVTYDYTAGWGDPSVMQFPSEFQWVSPSGRGVLTHYMPAHYSAGWTIDSAPSLEAAEQAVYDLYLKLRKVSATKNVLLPVGTDYTPPAKWVTEVQRDWNARYVWPRFVVDIPRPFFAAVEAELGRRGVIPAVQTRDMNPIYTGKDVSFIDTKQAQRRAENLLVDAEKFATIAALRGAAYPSAALDKAWRQLVFGAHHDAITGSESDQVYLDLLTTWREAHDLASGVLDASLNALAGGRTDGGDDHLVTVFNPSAWNRDDLVRATVSLPMGAAGVRVADPDGVAVPVLVENVVLADGSTPGRADVLFVASDVPSLGYRSGWQIEPVPEAPDGWTQIDGLTIANDVFALSVDPSRGGCVSSFLDRRTDRQLLQPNTLGNELLLDEEYPEHPIYHEGPWHLLPTGVRYTAAAEPAESVVLERSPLGERVTVRGTMHGLRYTQRLTLWAGTEQVDAATAIDGFQGEDDLVRVRWPILVPGALPVTEVGSAVVGRGFGLIDVDSGTHPWTLDTPACNWFALSSTARARVTDREGVLIAERAMSVVEIIGPNGDTGAATNELAVALVGQGVTSTASRGDGPRYGNLAVDSNMPDFRIALGGPGENAFVAELLAALDSAYTGEIDEQLASRGTARLWVSAAQSLEKVWVPSADLTDVRSLPVLIVVGEAEIRSVAADLDDAVIDVVQSSALSTASEPSLDDYTVAVLNSGIPSFAVESSGALHLSLLRSCTGWPSGVWIDPPRRTAPDGSNFQQEHWSHTFDYALRAGPGDWRTGRVVEHGHDFNHRLYAVAGSIPAEPARHSFLTVEPPGAAVLQALKVAGNPLARGRAESQVTGVVARFYEPNGAAPAVRLSTALGVTGAGRVNIVEESTADSTIEVIDGAMELALTPMQIVSLELTTISTEREVEMDQLGPTAESHQPIFSRYWLNNTGPAPLGNLPLAVHVHPAVVEAIGGPVTLRATVASNLTSVRTDGTLEVSVPNGWEVDRPVIPYTLDPGAFGEHQLSITPPDDAADGVYWIRVGSTVGGQRVEDVTRVIVGKAPSTEFTATLRLENSQHGGDGNLILHVTSQVSTPMSIQTQLISPWHTWQMLPEWNTGMTIPSLGSSEISFPFVIPPGAQPGEWWALAKLGAAGALHYTAPVVIRIPA